MKFGNDTVNILKNFSLINQNICFKPGNVITTISPQKSILARAETSTVFPSEAAVYDLSRLLGVLSLFNDPTVDFGNEQFTIEDSSKSVNYTYAEMSMIITPQKESINIDSPDVSFNVDYEQIQQLMRACNVMQLPEVAVTSDDGSIYLQALNTQDPTSDTFKLKIKSNDTNHKFKFIFKTDNLKLMNFSYDVVITSKGFAQFTSVNQAGPKVQYWIAIEQNSEFV